MSWMNDLRAIWRSTDVKLGLLTVVVSALVGGAFLGGWLNAGAMITATLLAFAALLLAMHQLHTKTRDTDHAPSLNAWLHEAGKVWRANRRDLGLIAGASAGLAMLIASLISEHAPSCIDAVPLKFVASLALGLVYGRAHLLASQNTDRPNSTPLTTILAQKPHRSGTLLLALFFYLALWEIEPMARALDLPEVMAIPIAMTTAVLGGALLPYVAILFLEHKSPMQALRRNIELVTGRWGLMFVCFLLTGFWSLMMLMIAMSATMALTVLTHVLLAPSLDAGALPSAPPVLLAATAIAAVMLALPLLVVGPVAAYRILRRS
ncbi:hypothetical protein FRC98_04040 [Lujinxingia vulgaris]|uniref:Uncharacterized protein n=1 Tax=Lujinxingia vulgaris TaxID=2600176 RepID=A0A5C6XGN3_9DELT|nr:hypothetical protein [Lujinxingia vulgaris]TXD38075.1 hypothetical protein FRC98_04040 [Lujinxingia vulgaris]